MLAGETGKEPKSLAGQQLNGEYEIIEALGHGATSVVYKSVRVTDGKLFAVKLLHSYFVDKEATRKRFEREASAAMLLSHPNLVKVHSINKTADGQPYLIMDYVEGVSLTQLIGTSGLDLHRAWKLFIQIADAMSHAHSLGVVHRSLKPGNVIVTTAEAGQETAMVSDFGLAKLLSFSGQEIQTITARGSPIGSPLYMSPEQCLGRKIDARADIYSMGCLMYICLTGKPPLKGQNIIETMSKHVSEMPPPFEKVCPQLKIAQTVQDIVFHCLAKRPEDRYESMETLKQDLLRYQEGKPAEASSHTPAPLKRKPRPQAPSSPGSRRRWLVLCLVFVLLSIMLAFACRFFFDVSSCLNIR